MFYLTGIILIHNHNKSIHAASSDSSSAEVNCAFQDLIQEPALQRWVTTLPNHGLWVITPWSFYAIGCSKCCLLSHLCEWCLCSSWVFYYRYFWSPSCIFELCHQYPLNLRSKHSCNSYTKTHGGKLSSGRTDNVVRRCCVDGSESYSHIWLCKQF